MPILNYTTKINEKRTIAEIQDILASAGVRGISIEYDAITRPTAITFTLLIHQQPIRYLLPSSWEGVHQVLIKDKIERKYKTEAQARRVAWRIIKNWVQAQIAIVEAKQAEMPQGFLPYALSDDGRTAWEHFQGTMKQITAEREGGN